MPPDSLLAAVDLGSNSFRLEIGRLEGGVVRRVEYLKETVRQGGGLDEDGTLGEDAMRRGWECLARFGERLAGFDPACVRAVATQTLREAKNRDAFIARGAQLLGFPIEVIVGVEEARLIYAGVNHLLPQSDERRLVVDIGGRSTELVLGQGDRVLAAASHPVGSVAWSQRYFPQGQFTERAFREAEVAALALLDESAGTHGPAGWDTAYGASGTVGAVGDVLGALGHPPGVISRDALAGLRERLLRARSADRLQLDGLKDDRRPVIGGGIAVLAAVFTLFEIETLHVAAGALRHGVLLDLADRGQAQTDLRGRSVAVLAQRFGVDPAQAQRVRDTALALHRQLAPAAEQAARELGWAAELHEIGSAVSHTDPHKHGAYILDHAEPPGFAVPELHRLALLVLGHRGKLRKLEEALHDHAFATPLLCLRLAAILCHARRDADASGLALAHTVDGWRLAWPAGWAQRYPQSAHLLQQEAIAWSRTPFMLHLDGG